jgi:hypothetical protein
MLITILLKLQLSRAQAAWLRKLNSTPYASLKKYPSDFFNYNFVVTEAYEVLYELTGVEM